MTDIQVVSKILFRKNYERITSDEIYKKAAKNTKRWTYKDIS